MLGAVNLSDESARLVAIRAGSKLLVVVDMVDRSQVAEVHVALMLESVGIGRLGWSAVVSHRVQTIRSWPSYGPTAVANTLAACS